VQIYKSLKGDINLTSRRRKWEYLYVKVNEFNCSLKHQRFIET